MNYNFDKIEFPSEGGTKKYIVKLSSDCSDSIIKVSSSDQSIITVNYSNFEITVTANKNDTNQQKTARVFIKINDNDVCEGKDGQKGIPVIVEPKPAPTCNCNNFKLTSTSVSFDNGDGKSVVKYVAYETDTCISNITAVSTYDWFEASVNTSNNTIDINPIGTYTGEDDLFDTITVNYMANGESCNPKSISVTQKGSGCGCEDLNLQTDSVTFDYDDDSSVYEEISFTAGTCISNITASDTNNFLVTANTEQSVIKISPKGENTGDTDIDEQITVDYQANGNSCSKTIYASQYCDKTPPVPEPCKDCGILNSIEGDTFIYPPKTGEYLFASANLKPNGATRACGYFENETVVSENVDIIFKPSKSGDSSGNVDIYVNFKKSEPTSSSQKIFFKYYDEEYDQQQNCSRDFLFVQNTCNCTDLDNVKWSANGNLPSNGSGDGKIRVLTSEKRIEGCVDYEYNFSEDWIEGDAEFEHWVDNYLNFKVKKNDSDSSRTGTLELTPVFTYEDEKYSCSTQTITITQDGKPSCECVKDDEAKKVNAEGTNFGYVFGNVYYLPECFESSEKNEYFSFEQESGSDWLKFEGKADKNTGNDSYRYYVTFSAETNNTGEEREAKIKVIANLKNGKCESEIILTQPNIEINCESITVSGYKSISAKANRTFIAYVYGQIDLPISIKESSVPSWMDNVSNIDGNGNEHKNYLYADIDNNYYKDAGGTELPNYKTENRSANITCYVKISEEESCEKTVEVEQYGWSGSCNCDVDITVSQDGCGIDHEEPQQGGGTKHFKAFNNNSTDNVLCNFTIVSDNYCGRIVVETDQSEYFNKLDVDNNNKVVADISNNVLTENVPVSITLRYERFIGEDKYEKCSDTFENFEIMILK